MNPKFAVSAFLGRNNFMPGGSEVNSVIDAMTFDMEEGLLRDPVNPPGAGPSLDMIPTWAVPPESSPKNKSVIVIDAGGTNFRSCLVTFDDAGVPVISDMKRKNSSRPSLLFSTTSKTRRRASASAFRTR